MRSVFVLIVSLLMTQPAAAMSPATFWRMVFSLRLLAAAITHRNDSANPRPGRTSTGT